MSERELSLGQTFGAARDGQHPGLRVAVGLYGDITYDSRVQREANSLADAGHEVTIYCLDGHLAERAGDRSSRVMLRAWTPAVSEVTPGSASPLTDPAGGSRVSRGVSSAQWVLGYARNLRAWGRWAAQLAGQVDVWHLHDMTALMAIGPRIKPPTRLVYDSHEIYLEMGSARRLPGPLKRVLRWQEGRLCRRGEGLVTINEALADYLGTHLRPRRTTIVRNCPPRWTPSDEGRMLLRAAAGLPQEALVLLYHGRFSRNRGIEPMIEALASPELDDVHAVLLGFGDIQPALETLAADAGVDGRVHFLPPVPPSELQTWVSGADAGVAMYVDTSLNQRYATPNKLWECISVGTPIVTSDSPMMSKVVLDDPIGPLGAVCDPGDLGDVVRAISTVMAPARSGENVYRQRCLQAARDRLNWETEAQGLLEIYDAISRQT